MDSNVYCYTEVKLDTDVRKEQYFILEKLIGEDNDCFTERCELIKRYISSMTTFFRQCLDYNDILSIRAAKAGADDSQRLYAKIWVDEGQTAALLSLRCHVECMEDILKMHERHIKGFNPGYA